MAADAEAKTHDDLPLTCRARRLPWDTRDPGGCGASWQASAPRNASLVQWTAALETERCPGCGAVYRVSSQEGT